MRIVTHTPDQLIIDDTPWLAIITTTVLVAFSAALAINMLRDGRSGAFFFAGAAIVGVVYLATVIHRSHITLDRGTRKLTIQRKSLVREFEETHPLHVITGAILQSDGAKGLTRPALDLGGVIHPLRPNFTRTYTHQTIVQSVNAWLDMGPRRG